ncbi:MAG: hypothetical protein V7638_2699 [Acidobacteriota bacterium]|jgi:hypothetical protein
MQVDWKWLATSIIAITSLLVSLIVALRNWRYSETTVRYSARNQYMNALFDIDRQLIARPELWAIYDNHYMASALSIDAEAKARREAFIYLHLNLFETVYSDYNKTLNLTRHDTEVWRSWERWMRQFFTGSSEARAVFTKEMSQDIFASDFVGYINKIIEKSISSKT